MKIRINIPLIIAALLIYSSVCVAQQVRTPRAGARGSWRIIGTTQANYTIDHDAIIVTGPHG